MSQAPREEGRRFAPACAHQLEKLVLETTLEALKTEVGTRALARKLAGAGERVRRQFLRLIIKRVEVGPNLIRLKMHGMSCQLFEQPVHVTVGALPSMPAAIEIQHEFSPASGALRRGDLARPGDPPSRSSQGRGAGIFMRTELLNGTIETVGRLVKKVRFRRDYVLRILRLGSPDLIEAMLNGRLPLAPNLTPLNRPIPLDWGRAARVLCLSAQHNNSASSDAAVTESYPSDRGTRRNYSSHPGVAEHNERFSSTPLATVGFSSVNPRAFPHDGECSLISMSIGQKYRRATPCSGLKACARAPSGRTYPVLD